MFDRKAKVISSIVALLTVVPLVSSCAQLKSIFPQTDNNTDSTPQTQVKPKKKGVVVWFVKAKDEKLDLVPVNRSKTGSDDLKSALDQLLLGPAEAEEGISSEIPAGTILLGIKEDGDNVVVDLSKRFTSKGGSLSIQTRLDQLTKTVSDVAKNKKIYLDVEGERLTTLGEEGLEVKQPIN